MAKLPDWLIFSLPWLLAVVIGAVAVYGAATGAISWAAPSIEVQCPEGYVAKVSKTAENKTVVTCWRESDHVER